MFAENMSDGLVDLGFFRNHFDVPTDLRFDIVFFSIVT